MDKKYKVVEIYERDAFYSDKEETIGKIGTFEIDEDQDNVPEGFVAGDFYADGDDRDDNYYFWGVKLEEVTES